jgi:protein phosphatase
MKIISAGNTNVGRTRKNNEDFFLVDDDIRLYAVADGIGGHSGGEVASRMAIETLQEIIGANRPGGDKRSGGPVASVLENAFTVANARMIDAGLRKPELSGMGTTLTALFLTETDIHVAHVGDSRAYLLRDGVLNQVTDDHGVVAEQVRAGLITPDQARRSPYRHIITRALGIDRQVRVDHKTIEPRQNDLFLLCTDGLTEMVEDPEIERILRQETPESAVEKLIAAANARGGVDNITVIALKTG